MGERKHTKRCGRLLDFLQKWYSRTMVEVTLKNKGEDADKDVTYGDNITFQRIIVIEDHKQLIVKKNRPTKMLEIRNISLYTESSQRTAACKAESTDLSRRVGQEIRINCMGPGDDIGVDTWKDQLNTWYVQCECEEFSKKENDEAEETVQEIVESPPEPS